MIRFNGERTVKVFDPFLDVVFRPPTQVEVALELELIDFSVPGVVFDQSLSADDRKDCYGEGGESEPQTIAALVRCRALGSDRLRPAVPL